MILIILGLLDILAGVLLGLTRLFPLGNNQLVFWLAVIFVLKGLYSVITAAGAGFFLDAMGWLDVVAGAFLFWVNTGATYGFFLYVGVFLAIKGIYSAGMELLKYGVAG